MSNPTHAEELFTEILDFPNATRLVEGEGRVLDYLKAHNPVQFIYRHDVDVSQWFVRNTLEYNRGEEVGVISEPGDLTLAVKQGRSVLVHDLNLCEDEDVLESFLFEVETSEVEFAFAVRT